MRRRAENNEQGHLTARLMFCWRLC